MNSPPAHLILTTGSRAGMVAPIRLGYYLIGRDSECQIRPKTRSVSRTHCLLFFGTGSPDPNKRQSEENDADDSAPRMHVFDLNSTSGTKINGQRVPKRVWVPLERGVELRCGKIAWRVVVERGTTPRPSPIIQATPGVTEPTGRATPADVAPPSATPEVDSHIEPDAPTVATDSESIVDSGLIDAGSLTPGKAWQEDDVAAFLAAHDEADRANRYDQIRQNVRSREERFGGADTEDSFEAEPFDTTTETTDETMAESRGDANKSKPTLPPKPKKRSKTKRTVNLPIEKIQLFVAFVVTVAILGFFVAKVIEFTSGPPVEIRQEID